MELEKTQPVTDLPDEPEASKKRNKSAGDPNSTIKKFDGWSLDPFAEIKPYSVKTPLYDVVNDLPLPITYDDRGKVKGIFDCFNCGSNEHRCNECPVVLDHSCVHLNKSWMQAYGKAPTARSYRPPRGKVRYFEKLKDLDDDENKEAEDEEVKASGLKFFDSIEEMPEVPKLATNRAKSISQMEKDEEEFRKRRRGNRRHSSGNHDRRHRDHRNFDSYGGRGGRDSYGGRGRAGYQKRYNNYQDRRNQPYDDRRRNNYRQQNWRGGRGGHYNNNRRRGRGRGGGYQNENGGYQTQNFYHNPNQQQYQHKYF